MPGMVQDRSWLPPGLGVQDRHCLQNCRGDTGLGWYFQITRTLPPPPRESGLRILHSVTRNFETRLSEVSEKVCELVWGADFMYSGYHPGIWGGGELGWMTFVPFVRAVQKARLPMPDVCPTAERVESENAVKARLPSRGL